MIIANVICDSINPAGDRITTGLWTYPRFIHSEIMTHRMLAKNSASSRAIPVEKMIAAVRANPATFEQYGRANKGMSAQEEMHFLTREEFQKAWEFRAFHACAFAEDWKDRAAKQMINRALEPWAHMTIVITGTDWENFFALRAHPDAQPEFQVLAYRWLNEYLKSEPVKRGWGEWHLPFVDQRGSNGNESRLTSGAVLDAWKIRSVACAHRVSFTQHDKESTPEKDKALHDKGIVLGHMSPFEHQARASCGDPVFESGRVDNTEYYGCFKGWKPYRKFLPNENRTGVDLHRLLRDKPSWITL